MILYHATAPSWSGLLKSVPITHNILPEIQDCAEHSLQHQIVTIASD